MSKLLVFDIESMANLVWSWDVYSKGGWRAIDTEVEWYPISFACKWLGEDKVYYHSLEHYKGYKIPMKRYKDGFRWTEPNIKPLVQEMWGYFEQADLVMGWNSKRFDVKKMNDKFLEYGFEPYSPFKQVDAMQEKRKLAASSSYSLRDTSVQWGTGEKLDNDGWPLWIACAEGDKKALKEMREYCIRDVEVTEKNYLHIRPWITNHPPTGIMDGVPGACHACGATDFAELENRDYTKTGWKRRWRCVAPDKTKRAGICGAVRTGSTLHKVEDKTNRLE